MRTQDRLGAEKCRPWAMLGRAMFTTVRSRMIMSWAQSTMARATPRRSLRPESLAGPRIMVCGIDDVDMNAFLENDDESSGRRARPARRMRYYVNRR